jgi:hypothetical protein
MLSLKNLLEINSMKANAALTPKRLSKEIPVDEAV